jgi:hypothetical protein
MFTSLEGNGVVELARAEGARDLEVVAKALRPTL